MLRNWRFVFFGAVLGFGLLVLLGLLAVALPGYTVLGSPTVQGPVKDQCIGCHSGMGQALEGGKHASFDCSLCHEPGGHPSNPTQVRPRTILDPELCGSCHTDQYDSFFTVNLKSGARVEKAGPEGRAPTMDKLLAPHGFTKEHNDPRSHAFMLTDHLTVDRAYGGRFQYEGWDDILKTGKAWELLVDKGPQVTLRQSAKAANPVCLQCKSSDVILKWKFKGEPDPRAQWDRTSVVADMAKDINNVVACIQCHDPHATRPRIVRDALIEAVQRDGTYPYQPDKGESRVQIDVQDFREFRKIGLLSRPDSNLMCAQCHVEYNCNPGIDISTGNPITMADPRTNYFPWQSLLDLQTRYDNLAFRDFKHATTGATLIKMQHPESETNWGSKHDAAGVECKNCHMPKAQNAFGQTYTSHWQASPRNFIEGTCLTCHSELSREEAEYQIDSIQNYVRGRMRKAEFWLEKLIDTFQASKDAGVAESVLQEARKQHETAHVLWEWWTAENSDGFHNPELARESLTQSIDGAQKGVSLLEQALAEKRR